MGYEKEETVNKIQNTIMNSLANIYQKAEQIEKVDKQKADWILKRIEEIRKDIENHQTQAIEFLSEIMLLQTEIMNYLDTDSYKQASVNSSVNSQKNVIDKALASIGEQTISEKDKAALLQNQEEEIGKKQSEEQTQNINENMQMCILPKKHFWQKILERILNLFGRKQAAC